MNAMSKAHQIRRQAAKKHNCKVSEIYLGDCLRMAHHNEEIYKELKEAEERKAARKTAWNLQEEKRKKVSEKRLEAMKKNMNKIRAELNQNDSDNSIQQQVAEAAFREDERFKKVGINIRYW